MLIIGATVAGELVFPNLREAVASEQGRVKWGYTGKEGPQNWSNLSPEYQVCQAGLQQSPINLQQAINADFSDLAITSQAVALKIENNGHTIQVNPEPGNSLILDETSYELIQFHFHHPSEHRVDNQSYPMELHFVHQSAAGNLAVLGVFLKEGRENVALKPIWDVMPAQKKAEAPILGTTLDISVLFPNPHKTYRYFGSLTTPPCSEPVKWVVFQEPIEISKAQIEQFRQIFPLNARPIQTLNRRFITSET